MGKEIERKFLVHGIKYREYSSKIYYKQGIYQSIKSVLSAFVLPGIKAL
ncbi:MAG: hypothetical protein ACLTTW_04675 [Coprobacter sp.]